jgi:hypothetical protein
MTHDHDTVVVERNGGSGVGAILGVIVVLALIIGFWYFAFGPGQGTFGGSTNSGTDINVNVELPSVAPAASAAVPPLPSQGLPVCLRGAHYAHPGGER